MTCLWTMAGFLRNLSILISFLALLTSARRYRSVNYQQSLQAQVAKKQIELENDPITNNIDFIWSTQTVAVGDTAVLHCSFDAIFSQLRNGNIDWMKESDDEGTNPALVATGKKVVLPQRRYRVFRPHNSALSVLIIRRTKKRDAGIYRCNLSGSSTRHKFLILNVTESKIEAQTSPAELKARIGKDITLWCNATGYPRPVVYWTREDSNRRLPDGSYQYWGNGLYVHHASEIDSGLYACYLDNFVQPVVSYKFSLTVEDRPWHLDGFKMRFDSSQWVPYNSDLPKPVQGKSYLLMCETRGHPKPMPKIRWFKDDMEIRNNKHFYTINDAPDWRPGYCSSTLVIIKFVPRHQANYTCIASNHFRTRVREFIIHGYEPYSKGSDDDGDENAFDNIIGKMPRPSGSHAHVSNSLNKAKNNIKVHHEMPFVIENNMGGMEVDVIKFLRNNTEATRKIDESVVTQLRPPRLRPSKEQASDESAERDEEDDSEEQQDMEGFLPPPDDEDFNASGSGEENEEEKVPKKIKNILNKG